MSLKKSEKLDIREVNMKGEYMHTLKEKGLILLVLLLYIIAWIVIVIVYTIDLNTFLMIIMSWLFPLMLSFVWIRAETRLNVALDYIKKITQDKDEEI